MLRPRPKPDTGPKENTGTLLGALGGALIGSQFGGGTGERVAAGLAGAAIGGLIGNRIGAGMDDDDKQRAYVAQMQALETGTLRHGGAVEEPGLRPLWLGRSRSRLSVEWTAVPAVHPHDLHRRPAGGGARHRLPQSRRHLDRSGLTTQRHRRVMRWRGRGDMSLRMNLCSIT